MVHVVIREIETKIFEVGGYYFNVDLAATMASSSELSIITVSPAWIEMTEVNEEYALKSSDLNDPVFVCQLVHDGKLIPFLIDGHHRMMKAVRLGKSVIFAYIFSVEQSLKIMYDCPDGMRKKLIKEAKRYVPK